MSLTAEWRKRITDFKTVLSWQFYRPLGAVDLTGFVTLDQISAEEAATREFKPMPVGTPWGLKWEYAWFKATVILPEQAQGKRIALKFAGGDESAIYVNGRNAGCARPFSTQKSPSRPAQSPEPATTFSSRHTPDTASARRAAAPRLPAWRQCPEITAPQAVVQEVSFGIWEEDAYQLWIDAETLALLRDQLDPNSLRVMEI